MERRTPCPPRLRALTFVAAFALVPLAALAQAPAARPADPQAQREGAAMSEGDALFRSVVRVQAKATPNARSARSLGSKRDGTGIVIGRDGLILTIGYLIVEVDEVSITDHRGRELPATVVGYDHATGFGLLRSIVPLDGAPVALGSSADLADRDPVMIASRGDSDDVAYAWVVSRRPFSGNWEYMLEQPLWTSPPMPNWSGAGLFDRDAKLVGIGSLIVRDATGEEPRLPGNLFVPIDALKPILDELVADGRRKGPPRPWLGLAADEVQGRLVVSRVSDDGPADKAGIEPGDIVLSVGGEAVRTQRDFYRKVWTGRTAGADVSLRVLQGADVREIAVKSIDRTEYFRPRTAH